MSDRVALLVGLVGLAACAQIDVVAVDDGPAAFCARPGPAVLPDGTCTGRLAAALFDRALVACGALALDQPLATDGYDSRLGPYAPGGAGGDVAGAAAFTLAADARLGGHLTVAGALEAGPTLAIGGDLAVGGRLGRPSSTIAVTGAARLGGDVAVTSLTVDGALTTVPGATLAGAITAGSRATAAVEVAGPAACLAAAIDVPAIIADLAAANHDAALGLDPAALADVTGPRTLTLPCGRYYLDRIQGNGATVVLSITGKVVLAIAGGITVDAELVVDVAPGAELDLFVAGPVNLPPATRVGDPARPRATRLYLASTGSIALGPTPTLAAAVHAPAADVPAGAGDLTGALVVHGLTTTGALAVHHDRALADAAATCSP